MSHAGTVPLTAMSQHPSSAPTGKPTSYSRVTLSRIMTAIDVNLYGTVHGGVVM
jgi:acyl-CoA hydrolase